MNVELALQEVESNFVAALLNFVRTGERYLAAVVNAAGEQALALPTENGTIRITQPADPEDVIAWKKGLFEFKDQRIEEIMRQLARWYDVSVRYEGKTDHHFNASISRDVPVSELFHLLELTDRVHFSIEDKTIIVKP